MIQQLTPKGVNVPRGFATSAYAYRYFIKAAGLEKKLRKLFAGLDVDDVSNLQQRGKQARSLILNTSFPKNSKMRLARLIGNYAIAMAKTQKSQFALLPPLKTLPDASFAGQQETYLNVQGVQRVLEYCPQVLRLPVY
jgi:pyruvate,water dikinase